MFFYKKNYNQKKILLFIGSPRTGSTLLGQIINYHPNCLVANEFRLLNKIIIDKKDINKSLAKLEKYALNQFKKGLENDKKYGKTLSRYQKKWSGFQQFASYPEFQKQEIKLTGDKKAGGNIQIIKDYPEKTKQFFTQIKNLYFIQIVRNPIDAALSLMKSHNINDFKTAITQIINKTVDAEKFANKNNYNYHFLYYENLLQNPENEIKKIFNFLNFDISDNWLSKISQTISKPETKKISDDYKKIFIETLTNFQDTKILNYYI